MEIAGTAVPFIPDAAPVHESKKPQSSSKYVSYDDEEFEGLHATHVEREKELEVAQPLEQCTCSSHIPFSSPLLQLFLL